MRHIDQWLASNGLSQLSEIFEREQIDLDAARTLTDTDVQELGLPLGVRSKLRAALQKLQQDALQSAANISERDEPQNPERRQLTIMFCDLVGSTELARKLDPESLRELMQTYQRACRDAVARYEGHVAQYLGDGLMVYFGWPRAHEDDAERSVRAALDLVDAVRKMQAPTPLHVRIGIATGSVVVGQTGEGDASVPKLAVGETPNLAARLQGLAEPDQIIVSPGTNRLLGAAFASSDLGPHQLKGIIESVNPVRITGVRHAEGRFEAAHGLSALTPFVGRENEVALMAERWEQAKSGEGQLILVGGEPGIGKSRIAQALRQSIAGEPHQQIRYQCSPYHTQSALYPVIEQIEGIAKFAREDSPDDKLQKLEAYLRAGGQDLLSMVPLIANMLSIPAEHYPSLNYSPQKQKEMLLEALVAQIGGLARHQPLLMVFEDAHWVDPTTQEVLDLLVSRIPSWRILVLVTYRPEYVPRWSGEAHVTSLVLNRFNRRLGTLMAERVTGGKPLPGEVIDQILAKTDGVPLFVEELTKTVLESGLVSEQESRYELNGPLPPLAIPSTLHDSLMARLDRLAPVKEIAQIGSCIGREFGHELLAAVSEMSEHALEECLAQLVQSQLVFRHGTGRRATYSFKHALVQDAAHHSLLKSRRQQLHMRIAEVLEQRFAEQAANEPEAVARHYTEAGIHDKATDYWLRAGSRAVEQFAHVEAIGHLTKGLETLQALPQGKDRDRKELLLQTNLGNALGSSKGYTPPEVGQAFGRARELCETAGEIPEMVTILTGLSVYYMMRADYPPSLQIDEQILTLSTQTGDSGGLLTGHSRRGFTRLFTGDFAASLADGEAGLAIYDPAAHGRLASLYGYEMGIACLDFTAWDLLLMGFADQSSERHQKALKLALQLRHPLTIAMVRVHMACLSAIRGDAQETLVHANEVVSYCKENSILIRMIEGELLAGWAMSELGDPTQGISKLKAAIEGWIALGAQIANPLWYSLLARACACSDQRDEAREALALAFAVTKSTGERLMEPELYRLQGDFLRTFDRDDASAEASYRQAMAAANELRSKLFELRASNSLAELYVARGRCNEAMAILRPLAGWFKEGFDTQDFKEAQRLIATA